MFYICRYCVFTWYARATLLSTTSEAFMTLRIFSVQPVQRECDHL